MRTPRISPTWLGRLVVAGFVVPAGWALNVHGRGVSMAELGASWQVIDLRTLTDDPLGSLWHLHTQPPLHNGLVAAVVWLPLPVAGTLFALYMACLLATGLLLHDLLVRWRVGPRVAGVVAGVAVVNPSLLATIRHVSYEVPVAALAVAGLWAAQRYLETGTRSDTGSEAGAELRSQAGSDGGRGRWLVVVSVLLTLACLTRSLMHPLWLAGFLAVLVLGGGWDRRPSTRALALAVALPVLLLGGWVLKNQVLFGAPTLSSWLGFNVQRGIVAPMTRDQVREAVEDGTVSPLATRPPWGRLGTYGDLAAGCTPRHDHPTVTDRIKVSPENGLEVANFNHECYLDLYDQAAADGRALALRYPGRYLTTRSSALMLSFTTASTCRRGCTWMDGLYTPLLLRQDVTVSMRDWNLPLLGQADLTLDEDLSPTLALASAVVAGRGIVAAARLGQRRRGDRRDPDGQPDRHGRHHRHDLDRVHADVLWLLAAWTVAVVVLGGDLIEMGENGRFRAAVDPLVVGLTLGVLARWVAGLRAGRAARRPRRGRAPDARPWARQPV